MSRRSFVHARPAPAGGHGAVTPAGLEVLEPRLLLDGTASTGGQAVSPFSLDAAGGVRQITLGDVVGSSVRIGAASRPQTPTAITFDEVSDLVLQSAMPISRLTATEWLDTDEQPDALVAPSVGQLRTTGNLIDWDSYYSDTFGGYSCDYGVPNTWDFGGVSSGLYDSGIISDYGLGGIYGSGIGSTFGGIGSSYGSIGSSYSSFGSSSFGSSSFGFSGGGLGGGFGGSW